MQHFESDVANAEITGMLPDTTITLVIVCSLKSLHFGLKNSSFLEFANRT